MLFCKHNREAAKKKVPSGLESNMLAISKVLGETWTKESDTNKAIWMSGKVPSDAQKASAAQDEDGDEAELVC